jgi:hypothetical protein
LPGLGPLGAVLGEGGQGKVYLLPNFRLPDALGPFVYKEYKAHGLPAHGLRTLVGKRARLGPASRARLDELAVWPLRVVEDDGAARGVVMQRIPGTFFQERVLPGTGARSRAPREVQNLLIEPARAALVGVPSPTMAQRLMICRDFAAAVNFVHQLGLVVGDLNARNALFRVAQRPNVLLVDCDAMRVRGHAPVVSQLNAPDWDPPEGGNVLTQQTDLYKFGLFVLRCLSPRAMSSVNRDPNWARTVLDPQGMGLLRAGLDGPPSQRPSCHEWLRYLCTRLGEPPLPSATHSPLVPMNDLSASVPEVFLCHSSGDKDRVRALYRRLSSDGIRCWFDEECLLPGQDWKYEIRRALQQCTFVLACLSQGSIAKSGYLQKELKHALDLADEQPEGSIYLIPLRLEPCAVPDRLGDLHWADLFTEGGYARLVCALRSRRPSGA